MISDIKNLKDLQTEKIRLRAEINECKLQLKEDLDMLEERLKPANIISDVFKYIIKPNNTGGILGDSLTSGIGSLANKLILNNTPFPVRIVLNYFLKNWTGNYLQEKGPDLIEKAKTWWAGITSKKEKAYAGLE